MNRFERAIWDDMLNEIKDSAVVSLDYINDIERVNSHLKSIYGQRADFNNCLKNYFSSETYLSSNHIINKCDDISLISEEEIFEVIGGHYRCNELSKELLMVSEKINANSITNDGIKIISDLLGVSPGKPDFSLFDWLIDRTDLSDCEIKEYENSIIDNKGVLSVILSIITKHYNSGFMCSFPIVGTALTQPRTKYFYRGENAFYGSSKPSIFRKTDNRLNDELSYEINKLRLNEGITFFQKLDCIRKWGISDINWIAIAQHYGLFTPMIDITSDIKTALFFACCKYSDGCWQPLSNKDFSSKNSRPVVEKLGGDSRYGILYVCPTEINDIRMALNKREIDHVVIPVGYQPLMRCSSQYAYGFLSKNLKYDMLKDVYFDKYRFRLSEELCNWIFDEMDQGRKIYPKDDIPDISTQIDKIKHLTCFSDKCMKDNGYSDKKIETLIQQIGKYNYSIIKGDNVFINAKDLKRINKKYPVEKAMETVAVNPIINPKITIW